MMSINDVIKVPISLTSIMTLIKHLDDASLAADKDKTTSIHINAALDLIHKELIAFRKELAEFYKDTPHE